MTVFIGMLNVNWFQIQHIQLLKSKESFSFLKNKVEILSYMAKLKALTEKVYMDFIFMKESSWAKIVSHVVATTIHLMPYMEGLTIMLPDAM